MFARRSPNLSEPLRTIIYHQTALSGQPYRTSNTRPSPSKRAPPPSPRPPDPRLRSSDLQLAARRHPHHFPPGLVASMV